MLEVEAFKDTKHTFTQARHTEFHQALQERTGLKAFLSVLSEKVDQAPSDSSSQK